MSKVSTNDGTVSSRCNSQDTCESSLSAHFVAPVAAPESLALSKTATAVEVPVARIPICEIGGRIALHCVSVPHKLRHLDRMLPDLLVAFSLDKIDTGYRHKSNMTRSLPS